MSPVSKGRESESGCLLTGFCFLLGERREGREREGRRLEGVRENVVSKEEKVG